MQPCWGADDFICYCVVTEYIRWFYFKIFM